MLNLLITTERIGPYHNSRFKSLNHEKNINVGVIQLNPQSNRYLWGDSVDHIYKVFNIKNYSCKKDIKKQINNILEIFKPNVFIIEGWDQEISKYLIYLSNRLLIPSILLSDSRYKSRKRNIFKELIKIILLKGISSALVAGTESKEYLIRLKFRREDIFQPYDVVDNDYFSNFPIEKEISEEKYILSVSRFSKEKNIIRIIKAFEIYKKSEGKLDLLLVGSGPEEGLINQYISKSIYRKSIHVRPWQQINELPYYYKIARVLVFASTNDTWGLVVNEAFASGLVCLVSRECGCCTDLIDDGLTGWGFDPYNLNQLSNLFHKSEKIDSNQLKIMKRNIKIKIEKYNLDKFAEAVKKASLKAIKYPKFSKISQITSLILFWIHR